MNRRDLLRASGVAAGAALLPAIELSASPMSSRIPALDLPPATEEITPFEIRVPQTALDDLKRRLEQTRWPEAETVQDWSQGVPLRKAQALVAYWRDQYDWRKFETRVNALPQFRTRLDGLGIHFIHVRSAHENALPLLLTHGWPGSFREFLDVIGPLVDPTSFGGSAEDAFHVVIPSLPGFGFSDKPTEQGWNTARIARAWANLMQRLGYRRWVAQGGDWGAGITRELAVARPEGLIAAHVNFPYFIFRAEHPANPTPAEAKAYADAARFEQDGAGYFNLLATRPQTIGYALADSPVGQATWIYEKFQAWSDNQGNPEDALSVDAMLDNITLYWLTDTATSSGRLYWEGAREGKFNSTPRIELPMGASIFPHELYRPPRAWAEALWPNLIYWNEVAKGGHFAAFEQPALFAEEMRRAFRTQRGHGNS